MALTAHQTRKANRIALRNAQALTQQDTLANKQAQWAQRIAAAYAAAKANAGSKAVG